MNILIINYEYPPLGGGASPVSHDIAKGYARLGHEVHVVTMGFKGLPREEVKDGINIHRVRCWRKKQELCTMPEMLTYLRPAYRKARELHRQKHFDINHTHFIIPSGIVSKKLKKRLGIPYVITSHGSDVPGFNTDRFRFQHLFTKPILKAVTKHAKSIISPSKYLANLMQKNVSAKLSITVIPNGIDLEQFKPAKKERIILSTGRALPRKGFQHLIRAVKDLELGWEVRIAGDGPYLAKLKELAKGSKTKIVFHGWIDKEDVKKLTSKAAIFVLASEKENASIALLEGLASGCAIITTNTSGCPETVGKAGELIAFGDVAGLQQKILKLTKEYEKKGREAHKKSREYDINAITKRYEQLLREK